MAKESGLRIGSSILAIVLLAALPTAASFAEEAGSGAGERLQTGVHEGAKDAANSPGPGGKDGEAIDTRVTVQRRRLGGGPDKVGAAAAKLESPAASNRHPRMLSAAGTPDRTARNAVGVPAARHQGVEQRDNEQHVSPTVAHSPAAGTLGVAGSAPGGLAKAEGGLGRPTIMQPNPRPIVRPTALNRGTINGTSLPRPGLAPSGVGGPAKTVAGINGTAIRPKF